MLSIVIPVKWQLYYTKSIYYDILDKVWLWKDKYEIIFINDNSPDDTQKYLDSIKEDGFCSNYEYKENIWVNKAWNIWYEKAKYNNVLIINNDIIFWEWCIQLMLRNADREYFKCVCPFSTRGRNKWEIPVFFKNNNICWRCYMLNKNVSVMPIPENIVLWYWDDYIYRKIEKNIQYVDWAIVHHYESKTINSKDVKEWADKTIQNDYVEFEKIKKYNWRQ